MALTTYTAGEVLTAASLNDNFAFAASGGLVCVKAETAFSAVASATADSIFTSAYTNYLILINYTTSAAIDIYSKLRVGGVSTSTNYNYQTLQANAATVSGARSTAQTAIQTAVLSNGDFKSSVKIEISTPQLAQATNFIISNSVNASGHLSPINFNVTGNQSAATAFDGIEFLVASGTMTGSYTIYGYAKTV